MRPLARWRLLLAGMSSVALIAVFCAIVVSTAQLGSGAAKAGKPELQGPQQNNAWAQDAIQRWLNPDSAQPPKHVVDFQPDYWEWGETRTLHADSSTVAHINAGADKSEEVPGVIQEWTEVATAKAVIKELKYVGGSAKDPTGVLDHIQLLFTSDWAAVYFFSDKDKDAPLVFMLDGLIMHKHYNDKLKCLPVPGKKKAYYMIKPRSEFPKGIKAIMDKKDR